MAEEEAWSNRGSETSPATVQGRIMSGLCPRQLKPGATEFQARLRAALIVYFCAIYLYVAPKGGGQMGLVCLPEISKKVDRGIRESLP